VAKLTNRNSDKFMLRLPDGMRESIRQAADINGRSMNAEIVSTLEEEYPPISTDPSTREFVTLVMKYSQEQHNFTAEDELRMTTLLAELRGRNEPVTL